MPARHPLNVDLGLPLPEIGQASTVFSLTALFGAYLGIYIVLGIPALAGIAFGTVAGLFAIRIWVRKFQISSFEDFLVSVFSGDRNGGMFAVVVSAAQCAYAASELLILREVNRVALGMRADHATIAAIATGIIGYFYVLFGGYMAVYRTDIVQFALVSLMGLAFGVHLLISGFAPDYGVGPWARAGYWDVPLIGEKAGLWRYAYHFSIGAIMGFGLFAAAPDAWKRVFVVTTLRRSGLVPFLIFVGVGIAPFLLLLPVRFMIPPIPDGEINAYQIFAQFQTSNLIFVGASLGLVACFLSSFNSALLASVHVMLIRQRKYRRVEVELPRFHWLMAIVLVAFFFLFLSLCSLENPYLLGNVLLGPYAIIAGLQTGTGANLERLPPNSVVWISAVGFLLWFVYFVSVVNFPWVPTTYEVNTVPGGALIFLTIVLICRLTLALGRRDD